MATTTKRRRLLHDVYKKVPSANCKGLCTDSCGPAIPVMPAELAVLSKRDKTFCTVDGPHGSVIIVNEDDGDLTTMSCVFLKNGRCSVYEDRPLLCRMFGVVAGMRCQHGCKPDNAMSDEDANKLFAVTRKI